MEEIEIHLRRIYWIYKAVYGIYTEYKCNSNCLELSKKLLGKYCVTFVKQFCNLWKILSKFML
jgi:hypothetical protein